jgi:hypothetical protein
MLALRAQLDLLELRENREPLVQQELQDLKDRLVLLVQQGHKEYLASQLQDQLVQLETLAQLVQQELQVRRAMQDFQLLVQQVLRVILDLLAQRVQTVM